MRLSKEQYEARIAEVRQLVVRNRRVTSQQIADATGYSLEHAWKLRNIVFKQIAENIDEDVKAEAKIFSETIELLCQECWKIIKNDDVRDVFNKDGEVTGVMPAVTDDVRLRAIDTLVRNLKTVFDVKFDAGIFTKQLGKMQLETFNVFVDLVKKTVNPDAQPVTNTAGTDSAGRSALPTVTQ